VRSMTGFGQATVSTARIRATFVAKSYNNRYLDIYVSLPPYLAALEPRIRTVVAGHVVHGKVEFNMRVQELAVPPSVTVDRTSATAVAEALRGLSAVAGVRGEPSLADLLTFEGVVTFERDIDTETLWTDVAPAVDACLAALVAEREREGAATKADIRRLVGAIEAGVDTVESHAAEIESTITSNLRRKFREVVGDEIEESRLLAETASYLAKHTINEELQRLRAHIASFRVTMDAPASGKKLDFICQELNREINTIGSKNMLAEIGRSVVEMKDALENVREQIRNVE